LCALGVSRGRGLLSLSLSLPARFVKHDQRLRGHGGVALHHLHVPRERRFLLLVAHLERRRLDLDRLGAVLRKTLHRVGHACRRALRFRREGRAERNEKSDGGKLSARAVKLWRRRHAHFLELVLPEAVRVRAGGTGGGGGAGSAGAAFPSAVPELSTSRLSGCITTLPSKRTIAPLSVMCRRSALSVPLVSLTSTCCSESTVPLAMSTKAWL